jgi:hypothetical protein
MLSLIEVLDEKENLNPNEDVGNDQNLPGL